MIAFATSAMTSRSGSTIQYTELVDQLDLDTLSQANRAELRRLAGELYAHYSESDTAATRGQMSHKSIVALVGVFGTLAVLLAVVELARIPIPTPAEVWAVSIASAAVVLGLASALHHSWLLHRHQAERYQLLMWGLLIDPSLWSSSETKAAEALSRTRAHLGRIKRLTYHSIELWLDDEEPSSATADRESLVPPNLRSLYCAVRLHGQARYFGERSRKYRRLDTWTRRIPVVAFFLSVAAALGHFARDIVVPDSEAGLGLWLLCAAAGIPMLAGAFRMIRGAIEPARNFSRYHGKRRALDTLAKRIHDSDPGSSGLFKDFVHGEQILEAEHREWLRLMMEAEWIG
jgi:hypothetical protein